MRKRGYNLGQNLAIECRYTEGRPERAPALAAELVTLKVDLIVAANTNQVRAAQQATSTIPIVMQGVIDPVGRGLIASLARPGGNVTGLTEDAGLAIAGKYLELLKEAVPTASRIAALRPPLGHAGHLPLTDWGGLLETEARALGVTLQSYFVRGPDDLEGAFAAMTKARAEAFLVVPSPFFGLHKQRIIELAARSRLPAMYPDKPDVQAGGLMAYAVDDLEMARRLGAYVDRILKGAKPGELPVEQPTRFMLSLNLKTAKRLCSVSRVISHSAHPRGPRGLGLHHGVQDREQLPHTGDEGDFLELPRRQEPLVEGPDHRVAPDGREGRHVEHRPDVGPATPAAPGAPVTAAVPRPGGHPHEGRDRPAGEGPELGEPAQERGRQDGAHPRRALEEVILDPPAGVGADRLVEIGVQPGQLPLEPADVGLEAGPERRWGAPEAVLLRRAHLHQLPPPRHEGRQRLGRGIGDRAGHGAEGVGEVGEDGRIQGIGLGEEAFGLREVPHLPGVDDGQGEPRGREDAREGEFQPPGGLAEHQGGGQGLEPRGERRPPCLGLGHGPGGAGGADGHDALGLGHIDADEQEGGSHGVSSTPGLARCGLQLGPGDCPGCTGNGRDDASLAAGSMAPGALGLSRPWDAGSIPRVPWL